MRPDLDRFDNAGMPSSMLTQTAGRPNGSARSALPKKLN